MTATVAGLGSPVLKEYERLVLLPPTYKTLGYRTIIRSYCYTGDTFCQNNAAPNGQAINKSYATNTSTMLDAWGFIKSWIISND